MINSSCDLDYAVVAFVDILGFSDMVRSDCENKNGSLKFFELLKKCLQRLFFYNILCYNCETKQNVVCDFRKN